MRSPHLFLVDLFIFPCAKTLFVSISLLLSDLHIFPCSKAPFLDLNTIVFRSLHLVAYFHKEVPSTRWKLDLQGLEQNVAQIYGNGVRI